METADRCYILTTSTWVAVFGKMTRVLIGKLKILIPRHFVPIIVIPTDTKSGLNKEQYEYI
jgi:hypothetical protein